MKILGDIWQQTLAPKQALALHLSHYHFPPSPTGRTCCTYSYSQKTDAARAKWRILDDNFHVRRWCEMKQWTIDGVFPSVTTQRTSLSYFVTVSSADNAPGAPAERSLNKRLPSFTYAITLSKKNRPGSDASAGSQAPLWNHSSELVPQVQCHHTFHSDGGSVKDPVHTRCLHILRLYFIVVTEQGPGQGSHLWNHFNCDDLTTWSQRRAQCTTVFICDKQSLVLGSGGETNKAL